MATKNIVEKLILNGQEIEIPKENLYVITEDKVTVTTDSTKGVSPYNTSYGYTNIDISDGYGIEWIEGALYTFVVNTEMVVASANRNVRVRIGNGNYIPVMNTSSILAGSSYFTKANIRYFQYTTKYQSGGALHMITDSNTTYSSMTAAEITAGTGTTARLITPANLKTAIQTWNKVQSVNGKSGEVELDADDIDDSKTTNKFVTASEKSTWNGKQNQLTAGEGISIENNVISATSSGGGVDEGTVNNLIEFGFGRFDNGFKASSGLYKVLNALDDSDNLGLTGGETRPEIVSNQSSISAISHSYSAMTRIASSEYAMEKLLNNNLAVKEISEDWNSISIISESELASEMYLGSSLGIKYLFTYQTAQDAFFTDNAKKQQIITENIMTIVNDNTLLAMLYNDSTVANAIANSSQAKSVIAGDNTKLNIVKTNSTIMNAIANDSTALGNMSNADFTTYYLESSTYLNTITTTTAGQNRINSMSADALLPAIFFWTGLSGYSTFEELASSDGAMEIVQSNEYAMLIINSNDEALSYLKRQPGVNTVAYFPLTEDFIDQVTGNGPTTTSGTISFTTKDGVLCASCPSGSVQRSYNNRNWSTGNNVLTRSFRCNKNSYSHERQVMITTGYGEGTRCKAMGFHNNKFWTGGRNNDTDHADAKLGERALYTRTFDGTTTRAYINGVLVNSKNMTYSVDSNNYSALFSQVISGSSGQAQSLDGYVREVIMENRVRTVEEIVDYYNKTKREFGK